MARRTTAALVAGALGCAAGGARPAAPMRAPAPAVAAAVAPRDFDHGELTLTVRGKRFGHETFSIERGDDGYVLRAEVQRQLDGSLHLLDGELTTDLAWRPRAGRFRDVKDGVTISTLAGEPLRLSGRARLAPPSERTATGPVELFLADNTLSHFAPLCAIAAPAVRVAFPGMRVTVGAEQARGRLGRREVDLGGTLRANLLCEAGRLIGVDVPMVGLVGVRVGREADVAAAAEPARAKPALAAGLVELARTVEVAAGPHGAAATLACSLVLPPGARRGARVPGVVMITGSGAQDRDEDSVGPGGVKLSLFKVIAGALGQGGVASLRCDDRGTAGSTGAYGEATLDTLVTDVAAMTAALRAEPAIDRARVTLVGHSEGAIIAPMIAARDRRVAAIVLMAGPGRHLDVVLLAQVERTLRRAGLPDDERALALARHRDAFAAIRAGLALPDTAEAREWLGGEAWLRSHLAHDPVATAATLGHVAVMIAQGGVDQQVSDADADRLADAFLAAGNRRVTDRRYPRLDHLFAASATGDVAGYADPTRTVDAGFLADLVAFVAAVGGD